MRKRSLGLSFLVILLVLVTIVLLACEIPKPQTLLSRGTPQPTPTTARVIQATPAGTVSAAGPVTPTLATSPTAAPSPAATASTAPKVQASPTAAPTPSPTAVPTAAPSPTPTATPATSPTTYIIRWGDTLSTIARRYGTTTRAIMVLNRLSSDNIRAGQRLLIPATTLPTPIPIKIHVVAYGESLTLIARRYGVTVDAIVRANGLSNPNRIFVGQKLTIP